MFVLFLISISFLYTESTCMFDKCSCINISDQSIDIKCIPDVNGVNLGFPKRVANISKPINVFLINKYDISEIPDQAFRYLDIKFLIIGQNNLKILNKDVFDGVKSISMLHLIESNLEVIEPGALKSLKESLTEFGLTNTNILLLNKINEELKNLKKLHTVKFNNLKLEKFEPEWTESLVNLNYLSLASNRISFLDSNVFSSSLISIDLNQNLVYNMSNLLYAIQSGENLKELKLKNNQITKLTSLSKLSNLEYLDLSNNKIEILFKKNFINMTKLTHLYLSGNRLKNIDKNLFMGFRNLMVLLLNNNFLNTYPNISSMIRLKILDLSNQNGKLIKIDDYAFDRNFVHLLTLYLNSNDLSFEPKSFCSRFKTQSQINSLDLSLKTLNNMDKCIFKQFESNRPNKMLLRVQLEKSNLNELNECNCGIWQFAKHFNVTIYNYPNCNETECYEKKLETAECDKRFNCD